MRTELYKNCLDTENLLLDKALKKLVSSHQRLVVTCKA